MHSKLCLAQSFVVGSLLLVGPIAICNGDDGPSRTLFGSKAVQRELKLTDTQLKQVEGIVTEIETKIAKAESEVAQTSKDPVVVQRTMAEIKARVVAEGGQRFMALLDQKQALRFWQIGAQSSGMSVFGNNRVQRVLQLSDDQKQAMNEYQDRMVTDVTKIATNAELDIATVQKRVEIAK